jgi:hypothetical protein
MTPPPRHQTVSRYSRRSDRSSALAERYADALNRRRRGWAGSGRRRSGCGAGRNRSFRVLPPSTTHAGATRSPGDNDASHAVTSSSGACLACASLQSTRDPWIGPCGPACQDFGHDRGQRRFRVGFVLDFLASAPQKLSPILRIVELRIPVPHLLQFFLELVDVQLARGAHQFQGVAEAECGPCGIAFPEIQSPPPALS